MLRVKVALGRVRQYDVGVFDRMLTAPPPGYNAVSGYIRRAEEYAVYTNAAVVVTDIVLYRFNNIQRELFIPLTIPARCKASDIVFITISLSAFFTKLSTMAGPTHSVSIRQAIARLLRLLITPDQFFEFLGTIFVNKPPTLFIQSLKDELLKCNLLAKSPNCTSGLAVVEVVNAAAVATC